MIVFSLPERRRKNLTEFFHVVSVMLGISLLIALFLPCLLPSLCLAIRLRKRANWTIQTSKSRSGFTRYGKGNWPGRLRYRQSFSIPLDFVSFSGFLSPCQMARRTRSGTIRPSKHFLSGGKSGPRWTKRLRGSLRMFVRWSVWEKALSRGRKNQIMSQRTSIWKTPLDQMDFIMRGLKLIWKTWKVSISLHRSPILDRVLRSR